MVKSWELTSKLDGDPTCNDSSLEERASLLQAKYNSNYNSGSNSKAKANALQKDDSTDDLIASIKACLML